MTWLISTFSKHNSVPVNVDIVNLGFRNELNKINIQKK